MAKRDFQEPEKREFELHPDGQFDGFVEEVRPMGQQEYDNDDGSVTIADKVMILIRNLDGRATYTDEEGNVQASAIGCFVNFYNYTPGPKSRVYQIYQSILGKTPDFKNNFDDECVLGVRVLYQVVHNAGQGKHEGKTFANVTTLMRNPIQTLPDGFAPVTQASKQADEDAKYEDAGLSGGKTDTSVLILQEDREYLLALIEVAVTNSLIGDDVADRGANTAETCQDSAVMRDKIAKMEGLLNKHNIALPQLAEDGAGDLPF